MGSHKKTSTTFTQTEMAYIIYKLSKHKLIKDMRDLYRLFVNRIRETGDREEK